MVRIMEKAGMAPDGRRLAHYLIDGEPVDVVYYAAFG
jgi:RimJ/RimL family protein N-acetyltransferase